MDAEERISRRHGGEGPIAAVHLPAALPAMQHETGERLDVSIGTRSKTAPHPVDHRADDSPHRPSRDRPNAQKRATATQRESIRKPYLRRSCSVVRRSVLAAPIDVLIRSAGPPSA